MSNALTGKLIREKRKMLNLAVRQLAQLLDIKEANLYKWEKGTTITDVNAYLKLEKWYRDELENVPREIRNLSKDSPKIDSKAVSSPMAASYLEMIIKDNHELIEANRRLVIAHETIARTNEKLAENITVAVRSERNEVFDAMLPGLQELLIDLGLGKYWKTKPEGQTVVSNKLFASLGKGESKDIHDGLGKSNKKKS